jgi:hypothetical protein
VAKTKLSTLGNRNWFSGRLSGAHVTTAYYWAGVLFTVHSVTPCVTALPWIFCQVWRESFWTLLARKETRPPKSCQTVSSFRAIDSWRYFYLALSNSTWDTCLCCLMEYTGRCLFPELYGKPPVVGNILKHLVAGYNTQTKQLYFESRSGVRSLKSHLLLLCINRQFRRWKFCCVSTSARTTFAVSDSL